MNPKQPHVHKIIDVTGKLAENARAEARNLRKAHRQLLDLAAENMLHWQQLHHATLGFLACTSLASFAQMLDEELPLIFGLSGARLIMPEKTALAEADQLGFLVLPAAEIKALYPARTPSLSMYLGPATPPVSAMFSAPSTSMALIPLPDQLPVPVAGSVLVLGGHDLDSFTPDMGQTLLTHLAEIVGVALLARLEE